MGLHLVVVLAVLSAVCSAHAASPPVPLSAAAREFLQAQNQARAAVGVSPLFWSQKLAIDATRAVRNQRNFKNCQFANLTTDTYGSNQFWASGLSVTPRMAVDYWVKAKQYYNYETNACTLSGCLLYTQVVWKKTTQVGCAQVYCANRVSLTICLYNPPGNYRGQRPY